MGSEKRGREKMSDYMSLDLFRKQKEELDKARKLAKGILSDCQEKGLSKFAVAALPQIMEELIAEENKSINMQWTYQSDKSSMENTAEEL